MSCRCIYNNMQREDSQKVEMEVNTVLPPTHVSTKTTNDALQCENTMVKKLLTDLSKQTDIVIDFSSLKTCLNPMGIEDLNEQQQVYIIKGA